MSTVQDDAQKQLEMLRHEIRRNDHLYYVEAKPVISDRQYDLMMEQLRLVEEAHPEWVTPDSPTQRVGGEVLDSFTAVEHAFPMLSIDNTYNAEELRKFDERVRKAAEGQAVRYCVDPKIDGVAISLKYVNGELVQAVTRGDGQKGDDVTQNVRTIKRIPLSIGAGEYPHINVPALMYVRGEIFWPVQNFKRYNQARVEAGEDAFANPRNGAAGTIRQLDPKIVAERQLDFVAHGFVWGTETYCRDSYFEETGDISNFGIWFSPERRICETIDEVIKLLDEWDPRNKDYPYPIDGLVVKVDSQALRKKLGAHSKAPRWCVAYKFAAEQAASRLRSVDYQVGKLGTVTPVANLAPVELAGTTVQRASLHNFDQVRRLGICIGDEVLVEKAGEIIPQVVGIANKGMERIEIREPETCPSCDSPLSREGQNVALCCMSPTCPAQVKAKVEYFCGRDQMDIDGMGTAIVEQLVDEGYVRNVVHLYRLHEHQESLVKLPRMGKRKVAKLLTAIEDSKTRSPDRIVASLNIPHVGTRASKKLIRAFGSIEELRGAGIEELEAVDEIGPIMAQTIWNWFREHGQILDDLAVEGVQVEAKPVEVTVKADNLALTGKVVVATGKMEHFTRKGIQEAIEAHGGTAGSSVSGKTDLLVVGEKAGSKLAKAQSLGIEIIDETEFLRRIGGD